MPRKKHQTASKKVPIAPVERWMVPVRSFLEIEAASGVTLVLCAILALVLANSPWASWFANFWKMPVSFSIGGFEIEGDLGHLIINDAMMTIFFFVVGLEVKREIVRGELRDPKKALLPIVGAIGGVVTPSLLYSMLQSGEVGQRGWAIPMATDIAFVVGILALFGSRIPFTLKIFLLTLAIVDDLVAVIVIAAFFTKSISMGYLALASLGLGGTYLLNKIGVRSIAVYFALGCAIWIAFHLAGVHPTIAGVLLGLLTPATAWIGRRTFMEVFADFWDSIRDDDNNSEKLPVDVEQLQFVARESLSPLHRLELSLHPWVAFFVMPVFALANAGVPLEPTAIGHPIAVSIAVSLVIGKPVGILVFCYLAIQTGLTRLPDGVRWSTFIAGAFLGGIGFTMSLFLNALSFPSADFPDLEAAGKVGTLIGSLISSGIGCALMLYSVRKRADPEM